MSSDYLSQRTAFLSPPRPTKGISVSPQISSWAYWQASPRSGEAPDSGRAGEDGGPPRLQAIFTIAPRMKRRPPPLPHRMAPPLPEALPGAPSEERAPRGAVEAPVRGQGEEAMAAGAAKGRRFRIIGRGYGRSRCWKTCTADSIIMFGRE